MKMKRSLQIFIFLLVVITGCVSVFLLKTSPSVATRSIASLLDEKHYPYDHFFMQRAWPDTVFNLEAYENAIQFTKRQIQQKKSLPNRNSNGIDADWTLQGPGNIGGRFNVITIHPNSNDTIYAGSASGGVFKTVDGGQNWVPIFDDQSYLAVSAITLDPNNPDIVYVGTGDHNISAYPFIGDGVYKSTDAGATWNYIGLKDTRTISRIVIDPSNSNTIYVATMGIPFVRNNDRGLYKSTDGGVSWTKVLFVADQAGIIDLVINPNNPQILYASSWDRIRNNSESIISGANAKIWKTTDGGGTWTVLGGGLPTGNQGRIGLDIFNPNPDTLFALYVATNSDVEGIYRTYNGGTTWTDISGDINTTFLGGFGWYFGQIRVHPTNHNFIWALGVGLYQTTNGGTNWNSVGLGTHVDKHDLKYGQNNFVVQATDGGLYSTTNSGGSWTDIENIPNNQFYRIALNPFQPNRFYGGVQDNGSIGGNAVGINNWAHYFWGDGFQMRFSSSNSQHWYAEAQFGYLARSINGGVGFSSHNNGIDGNDRRSWDMPFILSHGNSNIQYCGTYRVYRNSGGVNANWTAISPDITDGINSRYHVISTVNESSMDANVLYAGTTDGNVWISTNYGVNWTNITDTLPDLYVTCVKGSTTDSSRLFVSHSGYKDNDFSPHLHCSDDYGQTWQNIAGDLPPLAINDIYIHPTDDSVIFVANDGGVYVTTDAGIKWERIGNNMPIVAVYDLEIELTNNLLVAGTFGRSIWTFPIDSIIPPVIPAPTLNIIGNTSFCAGDSVTISAVGGNFDSFLWSNGDTTQSVNIKTSGIYSVVGIQNGCQSATSLKATITVNPNPGAPVLSKSGPATFCEGDSVQLSAPLGFMNYSWSSGDTTSAITVNQSGAFTVVVTDSNGCISPSSATGIVNVLPNPPAPEITGLDLICDGNQIKLEGPEGFLIYDWSTGVGAQIITTNGPGEYTLMVVDSNGCSSPPSDTFFVKTGVSPIASFSLSAPTFITTMFTNTSQNVGAQGVFYWDFGDGSPIDSSMSPIHTFPMGGTYTVTLIVSNECGSDTLTGDVVIWSTSNDPEIAWQQSISLWPNPVSKQVWIEITDLFKPRFEIQIIDLKGRMITKKVIENQVGLLREEFNVSALPSGMYLIHFFDGENSFVKRLVKY